ncbi:MAG: hypothetical protein M0Q26_11055 [Chitinophagaceae bacterium]|nr:hypothetical protein [Chitinophagaceae bacterium]
MAIKNSDVMRQIEMMLKGIKEKDLQQYTIIKELLSEVYLEYNTGRNRNVERKLTDLIDAEVSFKLKPTQQ